VAILFVLASVAEAAGKFQFAPLFARPPYNPDGSPVSAWFAMQVTQIAALIILARIGIMATRRWVERENLFREMSTIDGLIRLNATLEASGANAVQARIETFPAGSETAVYGLSTDINGVFYREFVVPAGTTSMRARIFTGGTGTPTLDVATATLVNLTTRAI
jgi:hypothetical protein